MSRARVIEIHLQIADLHRELAEELEREHRPANDAANVPKAKRKRIRKAYVPKREFTDIEMARARQRAKKLGIPVS